MRENARKEDYVRIARLRTYLRDHLDEPLSTAALARRSGFSVRHFHRVFTARVGEAPKEHIRRLRLERAAGQLRQSKRSILAIALDAGFGSHEAFIRAFRERFGRTPTVYRLATTLSGQVSARSPAELWQLIFSGGLRAHVETSSL